MAIKRPPTIRPTVVKEFTDRTEPLYAFLKRRTQMVAEGSTIISFYGAGGVGKTALLRKLQEDSLGQNFKCVKYDFSNGTDVRDVLKTLKFQLVNYGCNFPLFDIGNYYYSLTVGQDISLPKQPTAFEQLPWVQTVKKRLSQASATSGNAMTIFNTTKNIFRATAELEDENHWFDQFLKLTINGLGSAMPIMRTITIFMSVADMFLEEYLNRKGEPDENHQYIRNELNDRRQKKDPNALYEFLPRLFAMDVEDWMAETGDKLIVFLDNYESLAGTTNFTAPEQRKRDLWLRGYDGLIYNIPDTLWTIAGRNELLWDGDLADELEQHLITALSPEYSKTFLAKAGISDENLRDGLVDLTKGYPIFLDLCVDAYVEYKLHHDNKQPPLSEFGQKREDVVGRILRYIDASDPVGKDMLDFLCVLNVWTDEIAVEIGGLVFHYFSRSTYDRVKNFSLIQSEQLCNDELNLQIFRFDKTIQSLIVVTCNEKLISDVCKAVNAYFKKFFTERTTFDAEESFCLKLWANFIVRFADDADKLLEQYGNFLRKHVLTATKFAHFNVAEEILRLFMSKIETLNAADTVPYTRFEMDFGQLRRAQGKYDEAFDVIKSAYEKRTRLLGENDLDTVEAMHWLAILFNDLGRYAEAVKLHEQVLTLRKNSLGDEHPDTVEAMHWLAVSLNDLGRCGEALEIREKVLALRKKICGDEHPDTFAAANNLAVSLSSLGRYAEALTEREKLLAWSKKNLGEEHPDTIAAMYNLALSLSSLGRYDEAFHLQKKVLSLYEEIFGEEHPDTIAAMNNLAISLSSLGRYEEALHLREKVLSLYKKILGNKNPKTLIAMNNLALSLNALGRYAEALQLQEKVLEFGKKFFGAQNQNLGTIAVMNNLALSLSVFERYEEALKLQEKVLSLNKKILGEEHPYTVTAMDNLALSLSILKRYGDALPLKQKVLALHKKILGEYDSTTLDDADTVARILNKLGRREEALNLLRDTLTKCEKVFDDTNPLTITLLQSLAEILLQSGERSEALRLIERALTAAQKTFGEEHSETKNLHEWREEIING